LPGRHDTFESVIITAYADPAIFTKQEKIFSCEAPAFKGGPFDKLLFKIQ
jgi:hypothetical protein